MTAGARRSRAAGATSSIVGLLAVTCTLAAGCPKSATVAATPPLSRTAKLVSDLAVFATGLPPSRDDALAKEQDLTAGKLTVEAYVDGLLRQPMGGRIARDLVIGPGSGVKDRHPLPIQSILRSAKEGGDKLYWLKDKCRRDEAVKVHPWWAMNDEVLVCPAAYRPDVLGDKPVGDPTGHTCGGSMLAPREQDLCGCGPNLMFCTESTDHFNRAKERLQAEVIDTAAYVVDGNLPIEQLFTMNETVRGDTAEFVYRRARVAAGEDVKLLAVTGFDAKGQLRPREEQVPGQHAGILTTAAMAYSSDALRGVMRNIYDWMWCSGVASSRVTTEAVLGLGTVDLRVGDGWKKLAAMEICTDCHARLDYGMQFFAGYPNSTQGIDFRPSMVHPGTGPLYGRSIKDARGTGDLTPHGFAVLATQQPEFGDCMTRRVVDQVFNTSDDAADYEAVHDTFDATHKIKDMLRTAMVRYAQRELKPPGPVAAAPGPAVAAAVATSPDKLVVSPALHRLLDNECKECHDKDDAYDFTGPEVDRRTAALMLDKVGFGVMPKTTEGLEDGKRRAFVGELSQALFPADDDRKVAAAFFGDGLRGDPSHRFQAAMGNVLRSALEDQALPSRKGVMGFRPFSIEGAVAQGFMSYTPGMALAAGVAALRDCKDAGGTGAELARCVERSSSPDNVIVGTLVP